MDKAKLLLKSGTWSIDDIADEVGFSDKSGFIAAFKRVENITPGQFKSQFEDQQLGILMDNEKVKNVNIATVFELLKDKKRFPL
ncbi:Helix-turn-helix domain-containing protein [Olivibacter domesticus]|uniref:Helix-turn-helix domain-containing protein n=2 Tax=Olivibacter domesticus TaxID=407022 RepID=A0A1H7IHE4_OLID1|nr:Helix-turn-helix domain-containing protein [Olivibacter domesticus]